MPIMRDTPPPLPADVLRELQGTLATSYGHRLVSHEGRLVLAVRVPGEAPDREADLVRAADVVPEDEVSLARDVLLMGSERTIRLDPIPLRDAVRERLRDDLPVSKEVRRGLVREYGAALFTPSTRRDACVAVRVPRASYRDTTPEDLQAVQRALEPVLAQPRAAQAAMCYLVADNDYRRCTPDELVRVVRGEVPLKPPRVNNYAVADGRAVRATGGAGMSGSPFGMLVSATVATDARIGKPKKGSPAPAAPALAPPAPAPPAAPAGPPLAPGLLALAPPPAPAAPAPVAPAPAAPAPGPMHAVPAPGAPAAEAPLDTLAAQLAGSGFEVLREVADLGIDLAAHQPDGKRLVFRHLPEATPAAVQELKRTCATLEAHAAVLVADAVAPGAWLEAAGTAVVLLPARDAARWAP